MSKQPHTPAKASHAAPIVRRTILRYALSCPRTPESTQFLATVRRQDPALVRELEAQRQAMAARVPGAAGDGALAPAQPDAGAVSEWRLPPRVLAAGALGVILTGLVLGWLVMPRPAPPPAPAVVSAQVPPLAPAAAPADVTPATDDQARAMTPREAVAAGADWIVVGRPITGALDIGAAAAAIAAEIA